MFVNHKRQTCIWWIWHISQAPFFPLKYELILVIVHLNFIHAYTKKEIQLFNPNTEISSVHVNTLISSACSLSWSKTRGRWAPAVSYVEREEMGAAPWQSLLRVCYAEKLTLSSRGTTILLPPPLIQSKVVLMSSPDTEGIAMLLPLEVSKLYPNLYNSAMVRCLIFKAATRIQYAMIATL